MENGKKNDITNKIMMAVVNLLLGIILTITWFTARDAVCMAQDNKIEVNVLRSEILNMKDMLSEIKDDARDIKRIITQK